jgi:hypothetical protein
MDRKCSIRRRYEKLTQYLYRKDSVGKLLCRSWRRLKEIVKYALQSHDLYFVSWIKPGNKPCEKVNLGVPTTTENYSGS